VTELTGRSHTKALSQEILLRGGRLWLLSVLTTTTTCWVGDGLTFNDRAIVILWWWWWWWYIEITIRIMILIRYVW
jgi:hypothetical protein